VRARRPEPGAQFQPGVRPLGRAHPAGDGRASAQYVRLFQNHPSKAERISSRLSQVSRAANSASSGSNPPVTFSSWIWQLGRSSGATWAQPTRQLPDQELVEAIEHCAFELDNDSEQRFGILARQLIGEWVTIAHVHRISRRLLYHNAYGGVVGRSAFHME
jgi:hypothetical protein